MANTSIKRSSVRNYSLCRLAIHARFFTGRQEMTDGGVDPKSYRNALGRFATGVTVVTTVAPDGVHGMTANAFTSVSLDPPLVLVSVAKQARTHEYLSQARRFGVSILSAEQEPFAWHFAGRPRDGLKTPFVWKREVPLLQDALAHLVCRLLLEKKKYKLKKPVSGDAPTTARRTM